MEAVLEALTDLLLTIVGFVLVWLSKEVREWIAENKNLKSVQHIHETLKANEAVIRIAVNSVEQMYKEAKGPIKFEKAKDEAIKMLNEVGLPVNEAEIDNLIEQTVSEVKKTNAYFFE